MRTRVVLHNAIVSNVVGSVKSRMNIVSFSCYFDERSMVQDASEGITCICYQSVVSYLLGENLGPNHLNRNENKI